MRWLRERATQVARGDAGGTAVERFAGGVTQPPHYPGVPGGAAREQVRSDA